jgi:hypothetical protein
MPRDEGAARELRRSQKAIAYTLETISGTLGALAPLLRGDAVFKCVSLDNVDSGTSVALEYYRASRAEIAERLKARDAILFSYLAAVTVLLGAVEKLGNGKYLLPFIIPLIGYAAATAIAQHQEIVTTLTVYLANEWKKTTRATYHPTPPELAASVVESRERSFKFTLQTQIIIILVPTVASILIPFLNFNFLKIGEWQLIECMRFAGAILGGLVGIVLAIWATRRVLDSKKWRLSFIKRYLV